MIIALKYVRLFVDDAGLSHFEVCTLCTGDAILLQWRQASLSR